MQQKPHPQAETDDLAAEAAAQADPVGLQGLAQQLNRIRQDNERLFRQLIDGEQRVRRLARAVWRVQEDERRRIAAELHDGLGQTLTALKIQIERLGQRHGGINPELEADLGKAAANAHHALSEARRLSYRLRPRVLDDLGLPAALRWLARTLQEQTGRTISLELEDLEQEGSEQAGLKGGRFDDDLETALFRVVQEAVSNALKHSGAQEVKIRLEHRPARRRLYLRVTDDGAGFDAAQALADRSQGAGFGLRGLRDRIEVLGGYFRLASQPGEGTMVEVELPLDEPGGKDRP